MFGSLITIFLWTNKLHLTREWNSTKDLILAGGHAILAIIAEAPKRAQASTGFEPVPQALIMRALLPSKNIRVEGNLGGFLYLKGEPSYGYYFLHSSVL